MSRTVLFNVRHCTCKTERCYLHTVLFSSRLSMIPVTLTKPLKATNMEKQYTITEVVATKLICRSLYGAYDETCLFHCGCNYYGGKKISFGVHMNVHLLSLLALQIFEKENFAGQYSSSFGRNMRSVTLMVVVVSLSERQGKQAWKPICRESQIA